MVKCLCLIKAKPGMTHEEFKSRWIDVHSQFAASWKNIKGYRINTANEEIHGKQGENFLFDGIGELYWDSYEDMKEDFESTRAAEGNADAALFMSIATNIYCDEVIIK